jgi:hypothetical protein
MIVDFAQVVERSNCFPFLETLRQTREGRAQCDLPGQQLLFCEGFNYSFLFSS